MRQFTRQRLWLVVLKGLMYSLAISSVFLVISSLAGTRWFRDNSDISTYPALFTGLFGILVIIIAARRIGLKQLTFARLRELEISIFSGLFLFPVYKLFITDSYEISFFSNVSYIICCLAIISACFYATKSANSGSRLGENLNA